MQLLKFISLSLIPVLSIAGILVISETGDNKSIPISTDLENDYFEEISYSDYMEFNNIDLDLKFEVVQYEIIFQENDTVAVSSNMYVYYVDETITSVYCLLTDGKKPLLEPVGGPVYVPDRKLNIITPKNRLSMGKFRIIKFLNERQGLIRVGSPWNVSAKYIVKQGDRWYLTLAVPTSGEKTGYSISIHTQKKSMEIKQLTRHNNLGFFSVKYNHFFGKYYAIKLSWLGGLSVCDVSQEINTKDGSIIELHVIGHLKGNLNIFLPNGENQFFDKSGSIIYTYFGNQTGNWRFNVKAFSIYFIVDIWLLYIDVNPYLISY